MAPIRIAIIGGGIGGCTLANGLLQHPHIEFDVLEGSHEFKERGSAVGLAVNAQNAMRRMGPDLYDSLKAAGGVPAKSTQLIMGEGPDQGKMVFDLQSVQQGIHVHRALFLKELLKPVPKSRLHVNKKLQSIEQGAEILTIHFEDGTTGDYHAVIGSDGIRSTVRKTVLADHPDCIEPFFTGFWDMRTAVPIEAAKKANIVDTVNPKEMGWLGDGTFMISHIFNDGALLGLILAGIADDDYDGSNWRNPVTKEQMAKAVANRGELGQKVLDLMFEQPDPFLFSQYEGPKAPRYCNGSVCLMGDAAHAMTPWHGAGAAMSIEDAMILTALMGKITEPSQIPAAFEAYDKVRRPRTQAVVKSSREVGIALCGRDPVMGMDMTKIAELMPPKWDPIKDLDMDQHIADAMSAFKRFGGETG